MSPLIVIPSYWAEGDQPGALGKRGVYDYTTPIDKPLPELENCLMSLEQVRGVIRVAVLVIATPSCEESARARVNSICRSHPNLNPLVVGTPEVAHIERAVGRIVPNVVGETVALRGYGAIKNVGLALACIFGHDVVVFLDDDEVVLDSDFLVNAVYGLGSYTRQNLQILAKSGYFIDERDSPYAKPSTEWTEKYWSKAADFNTVMERAQNSTRISRSNHMCGGCCAIHAAAFTKVPFDPYITRGEDLDYVLDLRSIGFDVWFDNKWFVRSQPPEEMASVPSMFMQDVHRWLYEYRKLDVMNGRRDLRTITPESLMPYPAPWLSEGVRKRVFQTVLRRFLVGPDRLAYLRILTQGRYEADKFAKSSSSRYLSFAMAWPGIASALWEDRYLQRAILKTGELIPLDTSNTSPDLLGATGAFPPVVDLADLPLEDVSRQPEEDAHDDSSSDNNEVEDEREDGQPTGNLPRVEADDDEGDDEPVGITGAHLARPAAKKEIDDE